jgi:hypothetical protein
MTGAADFTKMVPGFDFLQSLMKGAGAGLPQINQWIAPTLDPEELEKRIQDLKTVQFWLEQNTRLLGTTIQALEVQRMTLNTLKTMNLPLADLGAALRVPTVVAAPAPAPMAEPAAEPEPAPAGASKGGVDPMQWWGALTQQFTEIAAQAMKDNTAEAARQLAGNLVQQSISAAQQTLKTAVAAGTPAVKSKAKPKAGASAAAGTSATPPRARPAAKRSRAAPAATRRSRG